MNISPVLGRTMWGIWGEASGLRRSGFRFGSMGEGRVGLTDNYCLFRVVVRDGSILQFVFL